MKCIFLEKYIPFFHDLVIREEILDPAVFFSHVFSKIHEKKIHFKNTCGCKAISYANCYTIIFTLVFLPIATQKYLGSYHTEKDGPSKKLKK